MVACQPRRSHTPASAGGSYLFWLLLHERARGKWSGFGCQHEAPQRMLASTAWQRSLLHMQRAVLGLFQSTGREFGLTVDGCAAAFGGFTWTTTKAHKALHWPQPKDKA